MNNVMITPLPPTLWLINNVWDSSFKALLMKGVGSIQRNLLHPFFFVRPDIATQQEQNL